MAVSQYAAQHGSYPPAFIVGADGRPAHSWRILILPYLEHNDLYERYDFSEPWDGPNNRKLEGEMPRIFAFAERQTKGNPVTNYVAVVGRETMWPGAEGRRSDEISDNWDMTALIVENDGVGIHWMEPRDLRFDQISLAIPSLEGISSPYLDPAVVTASGQVRMIKPSMTPGDVRAILTIAGGERLLETSDGWRLIEDGRDRPLAKPAQPAQPAAAPDKQANKEDAT